MLNSSSQNYIEDSAMNDISHATSVDRKESGILSGFLRLLPTLGAKHNDVDSGGDSCGPSTTYYAVYVPSNNKDTLHIYTDQADAREVIKEFKQARFKAFKNRQQAVAFALQGSKPACDKLTVDGPSLTVTNIDKSDNGTKLPASPVVGEQPLQFKGPKPQEMVKLRKEIENGSLTTVRDIIWENPRYLVSSGDTPSILHEGTRYNALHVGAKSGNVEMCNLILSTIEDPTFIQLLYGEDNFELCTDRAAILLDLYINTPDKAMNETPLHFAVKFGFADVVELLTSYPQCNKNNRNKFGFLPKDIICERAKNPDSSAKSRIGMLLLESFYVPVIHSEDDCDQPVIGEPFNPTSPLLLNRDPLSPRLEIRAYAGPMPKQEADNFRKKWKTPPRQLREPRFRLKDVDKGLEKYGRNLAQQLKVGWKEYWPFLDTFTDLSSDEGLRLLEEFFKSKYSEAYSQIFSDSFAHNDEFDYTNPEQTQRSLLGANALSPVQLRFCTDGSTPEMDGLSPISDLCMALKACSLAECKTRYTAKCKGLPKGLPNTRLLLSEESSFADGLVNPSLSPFLCMERSCQVFAKRLADSLLYCLSNDPEILQDSVKLETKHLQQTVTSYMDDDRFQIVDFQLIHSRVAQLTAVRVRQLAECEDDVAVIKKHLGALASCSTPADVFSSDEEESAATAYRHNGRRPDSRALARALVAHAECVAGGIRASLAYERLSEVRASVRTEEESADAWAEAERCRCSWLVRSGRKAGKDSFKRNYLSRLSSDRRRDRLDRGGDVLSSSPCCGTNRRLQFHNENEDIADLPIKHCLTIVPNSTDRNHNSSLLEVTHSVGSPTRTKFVPPENIEDYSALLMSDDDSNASTHSENDDIFYTPPSSPHLDDDRSDSSSVMHDVSDDGAVDVFVYGDAPSKGDRDVLEAISKCDITSESHPNLYRWRHNICVYPESERMRWPPAVPESPSGPVPSCKDLGSLLTSSTPTCRKRLHPLEGSRTPTKESEPRPGLQFASWRRVTGINSPKSALAGRRIGNNLSVEF